MWCGWPGLDLQAHRKNPTMIWALGCLTRCMQRVNEMRDDMRCRRLVRAACTGGRRHVKWTWQRPRR